MEYLKHVSIEILIATLRWIFLEAGRANIDRALLL
jgi:hypothetical protein